MYIYIYIYICLMAYGSDEHDSGPTVDDLGQRY